MHPVRPIAQQPFALDRLASLSTRPDGVIP